MNVTVGIQSSLRRETAAEQTGNMEAQACPPTVSSHYLSFSVPTLAAATYCHHRKKGGQNTQEDRAEKKEAGGRFKCLRAKKFMSGEHEQR